MERLQTILLLQLSPANLWTKEALKDVQKQPAWEAVMSSFAYLKSLKKIPKISLLLSKDLGTSDALLLTFCREQGVKLSVSLTQKEEFMYPAVSRQFPR